MAYGDFKDLARRRIADKILCENAFTIEKNLKYHKYQRKVASIAYKFFLKITFNTNKGTGINSDIVFRNKQLAK